MAAGSLAGIFKQMVKARHELAGLKALVSDLQTYLANTGSLDAEAKARIDRINLAIDAADTEIPVAAEGSVHVHPDSTA
ncbi:hypothetical protein NDR87_30875 [Nocardia sp. CDC159]|uniref:Uncharacterized protein n=1 Tax=Nocardia pulmonis TaxID=2951408 RepID=A0A9X2J2H5_9NOCA|nr:MULTISPECIES: hypothetical protein [Nocardia]MCM6778046.1 hypothetical protein [Nocardia pulmonis]MCM6790783.1 hypothetical protein [Nocardia sp. CDC159]